MAFVASDLQIFLFRFYQACCLLFYTWASLGWPFCSVALLLCTLLSRFWPIGVLYLLWLAYDWNTPRRGSRPAKWARDFFAWRVVADYFPIRTIKTTDISADRNYIFAAHPHGILGTSSGLMFGTNATAFPKLFPNLNVRVATIPENFVFAIRREFLMACGVITSDAASIGHHLEKPPKGNAVALVPGGVAEMIGSKPDEHKLVLANRKGFVKLAIKHGASLVPVYNFGENRVFLNIPVTEGSWIHRYQKKRLNFSNFPIAYGRSFLSMILPEEWLPKYLRYGVLPFKTPIVSVVGSPIPVEKCVNPSQEQIDAVHAEYCRELKTLFDKHKCTEGGLSPEAQLEFI